MKTLFACVVVSLISFCTALELAYRAGRWGHLSYFGAEVWGLLASWVGVELVSFFVNKNWRFKKWAIYCLVFGLLITLYFTAHELMANAYGAGFEKAVFSAAPVTQWESVLVGVNLFL